MTLVVFASAHSRCFITSIILATVHLIASRSVFFLLYGIMRHAITSGAMSGPYRLLCICYMDHLQSDGYQ